MMRAIWRRIAGRAQQRRGRWPSGPWAATHRHRKGGLYRRVADAVLETDRSPVVIYDDADGAIWVRPRAEFEDGRFTLVDRS